MDPAQGHITFQLILLGLLLIVVTLPIDISVGLAGGYHRFVVEKKKKRAESQQVGHRNDFHRPGDRYCLFPVPKNRDIVNQGGSRA